MTWAKRQTVTAQIVRWTPRRARLALARTPRAMMRNPSQRLVSALAAQMRGGNWLAGVGAVRLSREGYVLDGQHRLLACMRVGKAICMWTVRERTKPLVTITFRDQDWNFVLGTLTLLAQQPKYVAPPDVRRRLRAVLRRQGIA